MLTVHEHFSFFPSLVSKFDISHSYAFVKTNDEVLDYLLSDPKGLRVPLLHGDAKRTYDLEILENFSDLKYTIQKCVDVYTAEAGLVPLEIGLSWSAIYENGSYIERHNHTGGSMVSGAYYPYIESNESSLLFENPVSVLKPTDESNGQITEYNSRGKEIHVSSGSLLLFPSWMFHYTNKNDSGKRIVISFDTKKQVDNHIK